MGTRYTEHADTSNGLISMGPILLKMDSTKATVVTANDVMTKVTLTEGCPDASLIQNLGVLTACLVVSFMTVLVMLIFISRRP